MQPFLTAALLATLTLLGGCAALRGQSADPYIGQFTYRYSSGDTYEIIVPDATRLSWRATGGAELGHRGDEQPERIKIADGIYFATWIEADGTTVTQVLDFNDNTVHATVVQGDFRSLLSGTIERDTPAATP